MPMKHFIGAGVFVVLALVVRFGVFSRFGIDIYIHDTYYAISLRVVVFRLLIGIATVWFLIGAYKLAKQNP
jgi:hypothetical protein